MLTNFFFYFFQKSNCDFVVLFSIPCNVENKSEEHLGAEAYRSS